MRVIIEAFNAEKYNLNLSEEQIKFARWLVNNDILYGIKIIDEIDWEDIE